MKQPWNVVRILAMGLALFGSTSWLRFWVQSRRMTDIWSWGSPFAFYETWGPCPEPGTCRALSVGLLAVDLVIWLAVVGGAVIIYRRWERR